MDRPTIHVRGHAVVVAEPDEARLRFEITALKSKAGDAHETVAKRVQAITNVLDGYVPDRQARTTKSITVRDETEWSDRAQKEVSVGYRASTALDVSVTDFSVLGRLVRDAVTAGEPQVSAAWIIGPDNPAREEACRQAGADARRRALAYAAGLGAKLGTAFIAEESSASHSASYYDNVAHEMQTPMTALRSVFRPGRDERPTIDFDAGTLTVPAHIDVHFELEPIS